MSEPGLSFGVAADAYERGRPEWPAEILEEIPISRRATVADLGAGTGKLTRLLAERFARVIAVEPDPSMRALIQVGEVMSGTAEAIPLPDASVDAVFTAEAFHWFYGERAISEIARVTRPEGILALLWMRYDQEDWVVPEGVIPASTSPKHDTFLSGAWRSTFEGGPFGPFRETAITHERDVPRSELLDYFASISPVTSLPEDARAQVLARIAAVIDRPVYRRRWQTCLFWTRLRG